MSIFIAIRIKGLIVGRSAEEDLQEALRAEIAGDRHPGPAERHHDAAGPAGDAGDQGAHARGAHARRGGRVLNALEKRIKAKFPEVAWCFVEPDVESPTKVNAMGRLLKLPGGTDID